MPRSMRRSRRWSKPPRKSSPKQAQPSSNEILGFLIPRHLCRPLVYRAALVRASIPRKRWPLLDPGFDRFAALGETIGHMDYVRGVNERAQLGLHMALFHREFDVLLTPTLPLAAFEAGVLAPGDGTDQIDWAGWTPFSFPFNLTQQPAASVPCGFTSAGLPVGLQIIAAKYQDALVLRVARALTALPHPASDPLEWEDFLFKSSSRSIFLFGHDLVRNRYHPGSSLGQAFSGSCPN